MTSGTLRFSLLVALLVVAIQLPARAQDASYRKVDGRDCAVVDMPLESSRGFDLGYVFDAESSAPGWEDVSMEELGAWARFGNWETESGGDFDLQGLWDTSILTTSSGDGDDYPLTMARARLCWTQRYEANYAFEAEASPGLYSGLESFTAEDFSVPFGGRWIVPVNPDFSWYAGANVYPTFNHVVDPRVGVRLASRDTVILDIGYPESSFTLKPSPRFRVVGGFRVLFWPEYNMGDDSRERLRSKEIRIYGGLEFGITEKTLLALTVGDAIEREISFESNAGDVDVDDAMFVGIGLTHLL